MFCKTAGRLTVFQSGLLMLSVGIVLFGMAQSITLFILARLLQGTGSTCIQVSGLALIMQHSSQLATDVGIQEMMAGIGYSVGPLLGGALYSVLGMEVMYMTMSLVPLAIMGAVYAMRHFFAMAPKEESSVGDEHFDLKTLMNIPIIASAMAISVTAASFGFLDTTLADHLRHIAGLGPSQAGVVYILPPLTYAIFSLAAGKFAARLGNKNAILLGLLVSSFAFLMIGPIPLFHFHLNQFLSWTLLIVCLVLMGVGETLILIPAVPLMLSTLSWTRVRSMAGKKNRKPQDLNDVVAGVFSFSWSFGDFVGPLLGE